MPLELDAPAAREMLDFKSFSKICRGEGAGCESWAPESTDGAGSLPELRTKRGPDAEELMANQWFVDSVLADLPSQRRKNQIPEPKR